MAVKFDLGQSSDGNISQMAFQLPALSSPKFLYRLLKGLRLAKSCDAIFISNPRKEELLLLYMAKFLYGRRLRTIVFDLIMRAPLRISDRLTLPLKRRLLSAIDAFIFIHKDTAGYEKYYGILRSRCIYVPFKANNFDLLGKIRGLDGDYIVSLGASQRDYKLLIDAVRSLDIPLKIILPMASITAHNADIGYDTLPPNVTHVRDPVDRTGWSRYIAESRFVVIPILESTIQPAGISVYLEAMALGKPVIITRGASTNGILDDQLAVTVPPADVDALRSAIVDLWSDGAKRADLSMKACAYATSLGDHARLQSDLRNLVVAECLGQPLTR